MRDRAHKGGQEEGHLVLHVKAPKQGHGAGEGGRRRGREVEAHSLLLLWEAYGWIDGQIECRKRRLELIKGAASCPCVSGLGGGSGEDEQEWYMLNDFLVERTVVEDALGFLPDWKEPCILLYRDRQAAGEEA